MLRIFASFQNAIYELPSEINISSVSTVVPAQTEGNWKWCVVTPFVREWESQGLKIVEYKTHKCETDSRESGESFSCLLFFSFSAGNLVGNELYRKKRRENTFMPKHHPKSCEGRVHFRGDVRLSALSKPVDRSIPRCDVTTKKPSAEKMNLRRDESVAFCARNHHAFPTSRLRGLASELQ